MNESFSSKIKSKKTSDLKTDTFPSPSVIIEKIGDRVGVSFSDKIKGIKSITEISLMPERFDPIQGFFVRKTIRSAFTYNVTIKSSRKHFRSAEFVISVHARTIITI